jgi:hypothetical protein
MKKNLLVFKLLLCAGFLSSCNSLLKDTLMKKFLLLLLIGVVAQGNVRAQYSHAITPDGPSHVLKPGYSRAIADTVYTIVHDPNPFEPTFDLFDGSHPRITGYTAYKHSEDGLTDTIYIHSGLARIDIRRYDENQRLVWHYPIKCVSSSSWFIG